MGRVKYLGKAFFVSLLCCIWCFFACNNNVENKIPEIDKDTPATAITQQQANEAASRLEEGFNYLLPQQTSNVLKYYNKADDNKQNFTLYVPGSGWSVTVKVDGEKYVEVVYDDQNTSTFSYKSLMTYKDGACNAEKIKPAQGASAEVGSDCKMKTSMYIQALTPALLEFTKSSAKYTPNSDNSYEFYMLYAQQGSNLTPIGMQTFPKTDNGLALFKAKYTEYETTYSEGYSIASGRVKTEFVGSYLKSCMLQSVDKSGTDVQSAMGGTVYFSKYGTTEIDTASYQN